MVHPGTGHQCRLPLGGSGGGVSPVLGSAPGVALALALVWGRVLGSALAPWLLLRCGPRPPPVPSGRPLACSACALLPPSLRSFFRPRLGSLLWAGALRLGLGLLPRFWFAAGFFFLAGRAWLNGKSAWGPWALVTSASDAGCVSCSAGPVAGGEAPLGCVIVCALGVGAATLGWGVPLGSGVHR